MYVCMYVCSMMHVCTVCMYVVCLYVCMYYDVCMYVYMYECSMMHVCTMYYDVCMYVCVYLHTLWCGKICIYLIIISMDSMLYVCMYVCEANMSSRTLPASTSWFMSLLHCWMRSKSRFFCCLRLRAIEARAVANSSSSWETQQVRGLEFTDTRFYTMGLNIDKTKLLNTIHTLTVHTSSILGPKKFFNSDQY